MFRVEVLPARYGDCLWIEYGEGDPIRRILIDGGAPGVYERSLKPRLHRLDHGERGFELLVVTHVDYDHIRGIIELAHDAETPYEANDVWFNGFKHLPGRPPQTRAAKHGEQLTDLLVSNGASWNRTGFDGEAVVVPEEGPPPRVELPGGAVLTLLAPTVPTLRALRSDWARSCRDIGVTPEELEHARAEGRFEALRAARRGARPPPRPDVEALLRERFEEDTSAANGSSIAFLLEYGGRRVLLAGDAHPGTLVESIGRLGPGRLRLDLCKLPHHGSRGSVSAGLIEALDCPRYVFSSNGDQFSHPHPEAVARVIAHGGARPELIFNYATAETTIWNDEKLTSAYGYTVKYPDTDDGGIVWEAEA